MIPGIPLGDLAVALVMSLVFLGCAGAPDVGDLFADSAPGLCPQAGDCGADPGRPITLVESDDGGPPPALRPPLEAQANNGAPSHPHLGEGTPVVGH